MHTDYLWVLWNSFCFSRFVGPQSWISQKLPGNADIAGWRSAKSLRPFRSPPSSWECCHLPMRHCGWRNMGDLLGRRRGNGPMQMRTVLEITCSQCVMRMFPLNQEPHNGPWHVLEAKRTCSAMCCVGAPINIYLWGCMCRNSWNRRLKRHATLFIIIQLFLFNTIVCHKRNKAKWNGFKCP